MRSPTSRAGCSARPDGDHRAGVYGHDAGRPGAAAVPRECSAQAPDEPHHVRHRGRCALAGDYRAYAVLRVDRRVPIVISSPMRGSGWLSANGCCSDPTSPHRLTIVSSSSGAYVAPETFAVDWIRVVGGRFFTGDGRQNSDWPSYGAPVYAVANGTVVSTVDGKPDIPPFEENPDLRTPADYAGNNVILKV